MKRLLIAALAALTLVSTTLASGAAALPPEGQDNAELIQEMGYDIEVTNLGPQVCGYTDPYAKEVKVNPLYQCSWNATLAHEWGHTVWVETINYHDHIDMEQAMDLIGASPSKYCSQNTTDSITVYENSLCEIYAGAAARSLNQPPLRESSSIPITSKMRNVVSTDALIHYYPTYSCRIKKHYEIWFNRLPDKEGFEYWNDKVWRTQFNLDSIPNTFSTSREYLGGTTRTMSNWDFARRMIQKAFERNPSSWSEQDFWRDYINSHGRAEATRVILTSGKCATNPLGEVNHY